MLPSEVVSTIRRIEITSGKLVNEIFAGQYSSVFKGRGMEFAEVREYLPGDDVRSIDWNVTARYGHPFVKKFTEERELTILFLVDLSGSQQFGTRGRLKSALAAELTAVLSFAALRNNDRVGMMLFTDAIEKVIRPKKGRNHILRMIRETLYFKPAGTGTDITLALRSLNDLWRRKAVVFLISDFNDTGFDQALRVAAKRHDLIAVPVADRREHDLPPLGLMDLRDPETGRRAVIDTSSDAFMRQFQARVTERREQQAALFARAGIDVIPLSTDKPYIAPLVQFFRAREKRRGR